MTYGEFRKWCSDRTHDGYWNMLTCIICLDIIKEIDSIPIWKRNKRWLELEADVVKELVAPTNERIKEVFG